MSNFVLNVTSRLRSATKLRRYRPSSSLLPTYVRAKRSTVAKKKKACCNNIVESFSWKDRCLFPFLYTKDGKYCFSDCHKDDVNKRQGDCVEEIATMRMSWKKFFTSGLLLYVMFWIFIFLLVATVWTALFETGLVKVNDDSLRMYDAVYSIVGISIGVLFWLWITQDMKQFGVKVAFYIKMLKAVDPMSQLLMDVIPKDKYMRDQKVSFTFACQQVETGLQSIVHEMLILLVALMESTLFVFLNDPISMKHPHRHTTTDLHLTSVLLQELNEYCPHTEMDISNAILKMYESRASDLASSGILTGGNVSGIYKDNSAFRSLLTEIETHIYTQDYHIYTNFIVASLFFVFLFFPYVLWFHFQLYTLFVYPAAMLVITGVGIISKWMGDPFEGTAGANAIDYENMYIKAARTVYFNFARILAPNESCLQKRTKF